jgi:hypothetical protein
VRQWLDETVEAAKPVTVSVEIAPPVVSEIRIVFRKREGKRSDLIKTWLADVLKRESEKEKI